MINVSIVNASTLFADADLQPLANALQIQVNRDFSPAWGIQAKIFYTPKGKSPSPDHWIVSLLDDADVANALGYHDVTPNGLPLGKAFVRTTQNDGALISVTVSHELLEMLVDPAIALTSGTLGATENSPPRFYAYECCDPVEADGDGYGITLPEGWAGAGQKITVSNFVYPSWFEDFRTTGPFDFNNFLTAPFELRPDGFISVLDLGNLSLGWQQVFGRKSFPAIDMADGVPPAVARSITRSRPHVGSRRSMRMLPKSEWLRSNYLTGTDSIAVQPIGGK